MDVRISRSALRLRYATLFCYSRSGVGRGTPWPPPPHADTASTRAKRNRQVASSKSRNPPPDQRRSVSLCPWNPRRRARACSRINSGPATAPGQWWADGAVLPFSTRLLNRCSPHPSRKFNGEYRASDSNHEVANAAAMAAPLKAAFRTRRASTPHAAAPLRGTSRERT